MTPIVVLAIAAAGYFLGAEAAQGRILGEIEGLVGTAGAQVILGLLAGVRDPAAGMFATMAAAVLLLVGATGVFVELKGSLDEIWGIPPVRGRAIVSFLRAHLHSFGLVLTLAFLLLVSLVLNAALALLGRFVGATWSGAYELFALALPVFAFGVIASLFAVIYKALPQAPLSWGDVWIGSVFTAALFTVGKSVIAIYLGASGVASAFGAAGSLIALLLWVYYSAQIFFVGAEFTRQYALRFGSLRPKPGDEIAIEQSPQQHRHETGKEQAPGLVTERDRLALPAE
jgi:membrane protein